MTPTRVATYTRVPTREELDSEDDEISETWSSVNEKEHILKPTTIQDVPTATKWKRELGLITGISIIIGNVIGSGVFVSPKGVLMHTGSVGLSLVVWLICGLISLLGAMSYIELGLSYPTSGGGYLYIYETIGEFPAFLIIWISCLARISTACVILSMTFVNYLLYGLFTCVHPPDSVVRLISAMLISMICFINMTSVRAAAAVQRFTVYGKLLALFVVIGTGIVHMCLGNIENLKPATIMDGTKTDPGELALAVYAGLFAYSGWDSLNFLTEELRDPCRTLPLSVLISIPLITVIYLLTNIAYFSVLDAGQLLHSPAVAVSFAYGTLGPFAFLIPLFVACSTLGSVNGTILCSSRTTFVAARKGHLPKTLAMLSTEYLTPVPSILMLGASSLLMLVGHDMYRLITYLGFLDVISLVTPIVGMLIQRYRDPDRSRPFRVWTLVPVLYVLICALLVVFPCYVSPVETGVGLLMCLSGVPVYLIGVKYDKKPEWFTVFSDKLCCFVQKLTSSVPED